MSTVGRNTSGKVAEIRDYFLDAEKDYVEILLKDEDNVDKIYDYAKLPLSNILQRVKILIHTMEIGVYKTKDGKQIIIDEKLSEKIEKRLVLLLSSIDDVLLENVLELTPDKEDISLNR